MTQYTPEQQKAIAVFKAVLTVYTQEPDIQNPESAVETKSAAIKASQALVSLYNAINSAGKMSSIQEDNNFQKALISAGFLEKHTTPNSRKAIFLRPGQNGLQQLVKETLSVVARESMDSPLPFVGYVLPKETKAKLLAL